MKELSDTDLTNLVRDILNHWERNGWAEREHEGYQAITELISRAEWLSALLERATRAIDSLMGRPYAYEEGR